jgi:AbrB family looped-hinge helix DNA binding protein
MLARYARRCSADRLRDLQAEHRYGVLACFLWQVYRDTIDYLVDMHDKLMTGVYNPMPTALKLSRVQRKGQVTIPAAYRERLGIEEGDFVAFALTDAGLLITPQKLVTADSVEQMIRARDKIRKGTQKSA